MSFKIAVCIKPVPDPRYYNQITVDPVTKTIQRAGVPTIINYADKCALETAIQVKEKYGGRITVFSMAPLSVMETIREALALGADDACLLADRAFAGADTLATSYTLAQGLKRRGDFDLVFTGTGSSDGATSLVPSQLAYRLGIAHIWNARDIIVEAAGIIQAKMDIEDGYIDYRIISPALLAISDKHREIRYPSISDIMQAMKKPIQVLDNTQLGLGPEMIGLRGSATQPGELYAINSEKNSCVLCGDPRDVARSILQYLRSVGISVKGLQSIATGGQEDGR